MPLDTLVVDRRVHAPIKRVFCVCVWVGVGVCVYRKVTITAYTPSTSWSHFRAATAAASQSAFDHHYAAQSTCARRAC